jgi:hypothetical protein
MQRQAIVPTGQLFVGARSIDMIVSIIKVRSSRLFGTIGLPC